MPATASVPPASLPSRRSTSQGSGSAGWLFHQLRLPWNLRRWWWMVPIALIPVVNLIVLRGWHHEVVRRMARGEPNPLPETELGSFFRQGCGLWLITLVYAALPAALLLLAFPGLQAEIAEDLAALGGLLSGDTAEQAATFAFAGIVVRQLIEQPVSGFGSLWALFREGFAFAAPFLLFGVTVWFLQRLAILRLVELGERRGRLVALVNVPGNLWRCLARRQGHLRGLVVNLSLGIGLGAFNLLLLGLAVVAVSGPLLNAPAPYSTALAVINFLILLVLSAGGVVLAPFLALPAFHVLTAGLDGHLVASAQGGERRKAQKPVEMPEARSTTPVP